VSEFGIDYLKGEQGQVAWGKSMGAQSAHFRSPAQVDRLGVRIAVEAPKEIPI